MTDTNGSHIELVETLVSDKISQATEKGQDFIEQGQYGKVKSRSHQNVAEQHPLTNVPTKYQLPTPYGFRDIAQTIFYSSRSLRQGQRSNQGNTMPLHTYTP